MAFQSAVHPMEGNEAGGRVDRARARSRRREVSRMMTSTIPLDPSFDRLMRPRWLADLDGSAFLQRCRSGRITRPELDRFVRQHHFYSRHFTRYLFALA